MSKRLLEGCPLVFKEQLPLLTELGCQAFGESGPIKYGLRRWKYYQQLHLYNPHMFRFVLTDGKGAVNQANIVGFFGVIPTAKFVYPKFSTGQLSQFEFSSQHVLPVGFDGPLDIYVQTLYLHPHRLNQARRLLAGLMKSIATLSNGGIDGSGPGGGVRIYAEATSEAGKKIMGAFDMRPEGCSKEGNPVLVIHTYPGNPLIIKTPHKILNQHLQRYVNSKWGETSERDTRGNLGNFAVFNS